MATVFLSDGELADLIVATGAAHELLDRAHDGHLAAGGRHECDDQAVMDWQDFGLSLEELEGEIWPPPPSGTTRLVARAHALRKLPVAILSAEDLRLLIRQNIGLAYLLPRAIEILTVDPMAEGDLYEGDLLSAVVTRDGSVWDEAPSLARELEEIVKGLSGLEPKLRTEVDRFIEGGRL